MQFNVILAGVGGQGILTIAHAISLAATKRGWNVKQAEVHGMAQRGGAVQSHLRFSDEPLYSDLIPAGRADMILAVEPLEALRYVQHLSKNGRIVTSVAPFVNVPDYPPIEQVIENVARFENHVLVDADRLARAAGSARAVNTVMLGAASAALGFDAADLDGAIAEMFGRKGESIVRVNQRACRFGRNAAAAYRDGLQRGLLSSEIRHWIETVPPEQLDEEGGLDVSSLSSSAEACALSRAEAHGIAQTLQKIYDSGRRQLYEHEVYQLVELVGAISPPRHRLVIPGEEIKAEALEQFPGDKVALKIVSSQIVHKSDAGAVIFVPKDLDTVNQKIKQMISRHSQAGAPVEGVLVVDFVERSESGFGQELFVGIRATREFGAIIAAGLGGIDTEFFAHKMKPGLAVAKALAEDTSPEEFFELFKKTAAYDVIGGRARGHHRVVADGELLRCFRAFLAVARRFCVDRGEEGPDLLELEVNPFAFVRQRMIPLDGRGQLAPVTKTPLARPVAKIDALLTPQSIAVLGVSGKRANFGRIILDNIRSCGYPTDHLYVIKEGIDQIDGIRCVPTVDNLDGKVDLLVVAAGAADTAALVDQVVGSKKVSSVILIPGGIGETEGTEGARSTLRQAIFAARSRPDQGPIVLGPNCLGVRSHPGNYDTFFIPENKMNPRRDAPPRRAALISQSGAFMISRMSNLELLDPTLAISLGNQIDLTVSDLLQAVGDRDDVDCIGVYVEGFNDMDGLAFVHAVEHVTASGKIVIFYKAGRTEPGRAATSGHTASVAGDYDICQTAVGNAGAVVVDTFKEFEQLVELATLLHGKEVGGRRIGVISNAGFETVGMADAILGARYQLEIPKLSETTSGHIAQVLAKRKLDALINVRNPLDVTPMSDEDVYEACIQAMLDDDNVDAVIVSCVPLTPNLLTTPDEVSKPGSLTHRLPVLLMNSAKPLVVVIDSGSLYESMAQALFSGGVPVFRSADQAVRSLGRYLCHRAARPTKHRPVFVPQPRQIGPEPMVVS